MRRRWGLGVLGLLLGGCPPSEEPGSSGSAEGGSSSGSGTAETPSTMNPTNDGSGSGTTAGMDGDSGTTAPTNDDSESADSTSTGMDGPPAECVATVDAAIAFLDALDETQRDDATYPWEDGERTGFEFLPPNSEARNGLSLRDVDEAQTMLFEQLLQAAMSNPGFLKVEQIRELESVLAMQEEGVPVSDNRDPDNYFITIFGEPNVDDGTPWGWRFEGHHLSIHSSMWNCEQFSATPAFWGASPMLDPIADEVDGAIALWDALDGDQQAQATTSVEPDAVLVKSGQLDPFAFEGLPAGEMTDPQSTELFVLIATFAENMNAPVAQQRLDAIDEAGFDDVRFAYDPSNDNWRVLGPTFIIEFIYAGPTHVHAVWRDYDGDYGEDLIAKHMAEHHYHH